MTLNLPGLHNVKNALAAFAAGILAGVEPEAAAEALGGYAPEGMRQHIYEKRGYTIFEDCYNANPESMRAALDVLRRMDGRRIAVLGDMLELGERSEEYHASLGADVASSADIFIACGEMMKTAAAAAIKAGMKKENVIACSKAEAAEYLDKTLLPGDRVLFKGSRSIKMEEDTRRSRFGFRGMAKWILGLPAFLWALVSAAISFVACLLMGRKPYPTCAGSSWVRRYWNWPKLAHVKAGNAGDGRADVHFGTLVSPCAGLFYIQSGRLRPARGAFLGLSCAAIGFLDDYERY